MNELLTSYSSLPESLQNAVATASEIIPRAIVSPDECETDGVCSLDDYGDTCNSDNVCRDVCSDCADCADAAGAYYTYDYTSTTITMTIYGLVPNVSKYRFFCYRIDEDGTRIDVIPSNYFGTKTATSTTATCIIDGRDKKFEYIINVAVNEDVIGAITIKASSIDVEPWSWSATTERENFYDVLYGNLPAEPRYLSHNVWNDLVDKVYELIVATNSNYGGQWNQYYISTPEGAHVSRGETLSALKFNATRLNLDLVQDTYLPTVSRNDPILPSYFITLTNVINDVIENG